MLKFTLVTSSTFCVLIAETIWVRFSAGGAAVAEVAALPVVAPALLSVPAALLSGFFASFAALLVLAGGLVCAVEGCLLSDFISLAAFDPFISPLSWAVAPLFEGGAVSAVDPLGAGVLLSAFGDGAVLSLFAGAALSLFDGAALSDFCAGASPFMPCASTWPPPNTSASTATELNREFFISNLLRDGTDD